MRGNLSSNSHPLVTIGIPAFNSEKTISAAIESVLQQDYENFELLVSDNYSTDATLDICESYSRSDPRVTVIAQSENIGAVNNFNFLLKRANGTYFCWLGSDDKLAPEHLRLSVELLRSESDLIGCQAQAIFDFEVALGIESTAFRFSSSQCHRIKQFFQNPGRSHGLFYGLYKIEKLRNYRLQSFEFFAWDWCLILNLLAQGKIGSTGRLGLISGSTGVSSSNLVYQHYGISGVKRLLPYSMFTKVAWSDVHVWSKGARVYLLYWLIRINIRYLLLERHEVKHWIKTRISSLLTGGKK